MLGNQGKTEKGYALHIDPSEGVIRLRRHYEWDQSGEIAEVPCRCAAGRKIRLEILRHDQILEVCVNTEQTLVSRLLEDSEYALEEALGRIEPTLVVVMAGLVGAILLSVMLPLMDIMTAIG